MEGADRFQHEFEAAQASKIKKLEHKVEIIKLILDITGANLQFVRPAVDRAHVSKR